MQLSTGLFAASLTFSAGALACAHPAAAFAAHHSVTQLHGGWMAKDANPKHAWIYVSGTNTNNVLIYDLAKFGTPQIGEITTGINGPRGLFLDPAGTLYVANIGSGTVTIYPAGATTPSLTLSQGLIQPASAAVDPQGNVWVTNEGPQPSIVVYPPGERAPSQTIADTLIQVPQQLTFDSLGNAYFADNGSGVSEILAGATQPVSLNLKDLKPNSANGIAVDPDGKTLYVSFGNFTNHINVYTAGQVNPKRRLSAPTADSLTVATFLNHEDLFVPGSQTNTVSVFHGRAKSSFATVSVATHYTRSVAYKPAGVL